MLDELGREFPKYHFVAIPTHDVRDKGSPSKEHAGLCDNRGKIHEEHLDTVRTLFLQINKALTLSE